MRRPATRPDRLPRHRLIVVDSSAVVAILFGEPSAVALLAYPERLMSVVNYVETGTVCHTVVPYRHAGRRPGIHVCGKTSAARRGYRAFARYDVEGHARRWR